MAQLRLSCPFSLKYERKLDEISCSLSILIISTVNTIFIRKANKFFDPFSEIFDIFLIVKFSSALSLASLRQINPEIESISE